MTSLPYGMTEVLYTLHIVRIFWKPQTLLFPFSKYLVYLMGLLLLLLGLLSLSGDRLFLRSFDLLRLLLRFSLVLLGRLSRRSLSRSRPLCRSWSLCLSLSRSLWRSRLLLLKHSKIVKIGVCFSKDRVVYYTIFKVLTCMNSRSLCLPVTIPITFSIPITVPVSILVTTLVSASTSLFPR